MKLTIFGVGYVGLVTAACFAKMGHEVCCVDINEEKIQKLQQGILPLYEPHLDSIVIESLANKTLHFTTNADEGIAFSTIYFIAVNTPAKNNGEADTSAIFSCVTAIAEQVQTSFLIINKSTAPIGTVENIYYKVKDILENRSMNILFDVASNPEFLREGSAISDCLHPDRIILGANSQFAKDILWDIYKPFAVPEEKILRMDSKAAELTKYAANAMLATKISFINEIARIAELHQIKNIKEVQQGIALDPRIGPHFISPGCGYGGACFPKDVKALAFMAQEKGFSAHLLNAVDQVNQNQKVFLVEKILNYFGGLLEGKVFSLWGLAFKPHTNDTREAPSCAIMERLWECGAKIQAYDPAAMQDIENQYKKFLLDKKLTLCETKEACLVNADALIICTEWPEFLQADLSLIKKSLKNPVIFDGRNIFLRDEVNQQGIQYAGVGVES